MDTNRIRLLVASLLAAVLVGGMGAAQAFTNHVDPDPATVRFSSAIVRLGPTVDVYTNPSHAAVNVTGISLATNGDLQIHRPFASGEQILTCLAGEDESLAALGVEAGCSGGGSLSVIRLYRDGVRLRADDPIFGSTANVWVRIESIRPAGTS